MILKRRLYIYVVISLKWIVLNKNEMACSHSEDSDQYLHMPSVIRVCPVGRLKSETSTPVIKLSNYQG